MEAFREFLQEFRPQHFGVAFPINMVVNTFAMWFVVNQFFRTGEKESIYRCATCAILLYGVSTGAILLLIFPTAIVFILAGVAWLVLSVLVIQGVFGLQWGGAIILTLYLFILVTVHQLVKMIMG